MDTVIVRVLQYFSSDIIKDLGTHIDNNLMQIYTRVASVISKANCTLGIIRKSFHFTENHAFFTLYKPLVRSVIKYGNTIWKPHYTFDQQNIERIQLQHS